jgi:hypothetical protein
MSSPESAPKKIPETRQPARKEGADDLLLDALDDIDKADEYVSKSADLADAVEDIDNSDPERYDYGGIVQEDPVISEEEEGAEAKTEAEEKDETPEYAEGKKKLKGSQHIDQLVLIRAAAAVKKGEKVATTVGDKKFELHDYYMRLRVDGVQSKADRLHNKAETAVFAYRRRKFAEKARLSERRLTGLRASHHRLSSNYSAGFVKVDGKPSAERKIRKARQEQVRRRIQELLKVERGYYQATGRGSFFDTDGKPTMRGSGSFYDVVGIGRAERGILKDNVKNNRKLNHKNREMLRTLIRETSTVGGLEAMGRGEFYHKLKDLPIVRDTVRSAVAHLVSKIDSALQEDQSADSTQDNHSLLA